jgi:hypothetical protein
VVREVTSRISVEPSAAWRIGMAAICDRFSPGFRLAFFIDAERPFSAAHSFCFESQMFAGANKYCIDPEKWKRRSAESHQPFDSRMSSGFASRSKSQPQTPDSSDPASTPILVWSCKASELGKARSPMNRLMVKPMPQSRAMP